MRRLLVAILLLIPAMLPAQPERGAAALAELVEGAGTTMRVLMIGAHPDDEDTRLLTWLTRGRHVETAYLSLTRGDGGQNLIGNELGEALGVIRTEELLAARRLDGAHQYFTRAYDFGFSKTTDDTYAFWPKDSILGDAVRAVRSFRPHVIVAVFSGTERDGHGHHQVSGLLAREAYDVAGDATRYPERGFGPAWTVPKFYRQRTYWRHEGATLRYDAGEFDPVLGASYAEIAGRSRSQHKSQAFGSLEPKGAIVGSAMREATRVNAAAPAEQEATLFDGIDTTWARFHPVVTHRARRAALDSLPAALDAVRAALDVREPGRMLPALGRAERLLQQGVCGHDMTRGPNPCDAPSAMPLSLDLAASRRATAERLHRAIQLAAGVEVLATTTRELTPVGQPVSVRVTVYNRGARPVRVASLQLEGQENAPDLLPGAETMTVAPGDSASRTGDIVPTRRTEPWWLASPRREAQFAIGAGAAQREDWRESGIAGLMSWIEVEGAQAVIEAALVRRFADPIKGEQLRPSAAAPAVSVTLDATTEYVPAGQAIDRTVRVRLRSADSTRRNVVVRLVLPKGLGVDGTSQLVTLAGYDARATASFRVRGELPAGRHRVVATAESGGQRWDDGYIEVAYDHIRPQRLYRPAVTELVAVDVQVPRGLKVAYVPGVGDNVAPMLAQLGVDVTVLSADSIAVASLAGFRTVVLGPRVYEANPALAAANQRLLDWARSGGTLVVQYQQDIARGSLAPFPLTMAQRADRVTEENATVRLLDPAHPLLTTPNRITAADFAGWVQERALYMPSTFDAAWTPLLEMGDRGMPPSRSGILVAPLDRGTYVLATLAFFRQLPAGNPGAARLLVNLLSASSEGAGRVTP